MFDLWSQQVIWGDLIGVFLFYLLFKFLWAFGKGFIEEFKKGLGKS